MNADIERSICVTAIFLGAAVATTATADLGMLAAAR